MATDFLSSSPKNTVLVVGGGVAGMQASLVLAERGHRVLLVESRPSIGGLFPLLDNQFPTQSCGLCFMACDTPTYCPFIQCDLHANVEIWPFTTLDEVTREGETFRIRATQAPSSVDSEKCTDCGECEAVCPVAVPREFGDGLETRKAIYKHYPKAIAKGYVVDPEACTRCGKCREACGPGAIDLDASAHAVEFEAGAVLLAPGAELFAAHGKEEYGEGRYPNVLSAVRFERMLAAGSPSSGRVVRPSDGEIPKSLAFVQCVGSRDAEGGQGHCSSACCMFTLKQALFAKARHPELDIAVYYMDLRAFGKGYESYLRRAQAAGVRFVRALPSVIRQEPSGSLLLQVAGDGGPREDACDLAVLAAGFLQGSEAGRLARLFGLELREGGFAAGTELQPCETNVAGVFACGSFREPKDIPETTAEAACAAGLAARLLEPPAGAQTPELPTPADFRGEAPKIGVVLCSCEGFNDDRADFAELTQIAEGMAGVGFVRTLSHACSREGLGEVRRLFAEHEPNRLVLASCSQRIVERLHTRALREMGVHPGVLAIANLREACLESGGGTAAASAALRETIRKAWYAGFGPTARQSLETTVVVVGAGAAGLRASLTLAELGHAVHLVEREAELGGNAREARYTAKGGDPSKFLEGLLEAVTSHPKVRVYRGSRVASAAGRLGAFRTRVETPEGPVEVLHGAVLLATGAREQKPRSYGYGTSPKIVTQRELEILLAEGKLAARRIAMIQCVESREEGEGCRPWCSRVCCTQAVKNALKILELEPSAEVTVLYRDLRTYGAFEHGYRLARDRGVLFTPYELSKRPRVHVVGDTVRLSYFEPALERELSVEPELLVLSSGMAPDEEENARLAALFGVEAGEGGFFVEKNPKAATTDFARKGVYMAGLCHAPRHLEESLVHAGAAAARCSVLLARGARSPSDRSSYVVEKLCSRCGLCVEACPYGARSLHSSRNVAAVDDLLCEGCGACAAACPNKAAQQYGFAPRQVLLGLEELLT
jgi:heterodisulfide reductase subunit A2